MRGALRRFVALPERLPLPVRRPTLAVLGYLLCWTVLEVATQGISGTLRISLWYPPSGLSVALLLFLGLRYWPAIAVTSLLHVALFRQGLDLSATAILAYTFLYPALLVVGCALFSGRIIPKIHADARLMSLRDVSWFVVILCLVVPFAIDASVVSIYVLAGDLTWWNFLPNVLGSWAGDATGVAVVVPLFAVASRSFPSLQPRYGRGGEPEDAPGFSWPAKRELPELIGQVALLAVAVWAAYGAPRGVRLDYSYLVFVPLVWAAARQGFERTVPLLLALNLGAVVLVREDAGTNPVLLQFGLMAMTLVGLLTGSSVSEQRRSRRRLESSERRFRSVVHNSSEAVKIVGVDGTLRYASPAFARIFGHDPDAAVGTNVLDYVHPEDLPLVREETERALKKRDGIATNRIEYRFRCDDGSYKPVESVGTYLLGDPAVEGVVINVRDVTERKAFEEDLLHQAFHDPLTELPNRALLLDRLQQALARADAGRGGGRVAVLFLDLDGFKDVNDSLGHEVGDELLVAVAGRLGDVMRPEDTLARLGGDEFCVLMEGFPEDADSGVAYGLVSEVAERLLARLSAEHFGLSRPDEDGEVSENVDVSGSLGIALSSSSNQSPFDLLKEADLAMYRAKGRGGDRFELFEPELAERASNRLKLRGQLARALERGEFELFYQPKVCLKTGKILWMEGLLRWRHPEGELLQPGEFVPLAEETGLIVPMGRWIVEEALAQQRTWRENAARAPSGSGWRSHDVPKVCVNLSARQLRQEGLVEEITRMLEEAGTDPQDFGLEVTESILAEDEHSLATLKRLMEMGITLSVDDFGTGYASLAYLKRFPADFLKIDCSFVGDVQKGSQGATIVSAMVTLAHATGKRVVAECVESPSQLAVLKEVGCEMGQGNLFSAPLPPDSVSAFLSRRSP